jgi:hypothetical protein
MSDDELERLRALNATQAQEIATAHKMMDQDKKDYDDLKERFDAQAQEVKRIKQMSLGSIYKEVADRLEAAEARVREMEADTKQLGAQAAATLKASLAAKEAATIERCAKKIESLAGDCWCRPSTWSGLDERDRLAAAIRALAKEPTAAPS